MAKLINFVKNNNVKKTEHNKLVTKIDNTETTNFVKKNKYEKDWSDFEDKINKVDKKMPNVSSLVKKTDFNTKVTEIVGKIPIVTGFLLTSVFNPKITEVEDKIPNIKNFASKTEVTAVENKIPNISNLVLKTDYAAEITKIKNDYITNAALDARHNDLVQKTTLDSEF